MSTSKSLNELLKTASSLMNYFKILYAITKVLSNEILKIPTQIECTSKHNRICVELNEYILLLAPWRNNKSLKFRREASFVVHQGIIIMSSIQAHLSRHLSADGFSVFMDFNKCLDVISSKLMDESRWERTPLRSYASTCLRIYKFAEMSALKKEKSHFDEDDDDYIEFMESYDKCMIDFLTSPTPFDTFTMKTPEISDVDIDITPLPPQSVSFASRSPFESRRVIVIKSD